MIAWLQNLDIETWVQLGILFVVAAICGYVLRTIRDVKEDKEKD